jgi:hypothetical protein
MAVGGCTTPHCALPLQAFLGIDKEGLCSGAFRFHSSPAQACCQGCLRTLPSQILTRTLEKFHVLLLVPGPAPFFQWATVNPGPGSDQRGRARPWES